jgi:hypothetical protein
VRYKKRIDEMIALHGEEFTINGTTEAKGFFMLTDLTRMNTFFDGIELSGFQRPLLTLQFSADTVLALADTIERDGQVYQVSRLAKYRVDNEVAMQSAILTQV